MPVPQGRQSDYITRVRQKADDLMEAYDGLAAEYRLWNSIMNTVIDDGDFVGGNEGLTRDDLVAALGSLFANASGTLEDWLESGHATNLDKIRG